MSDLTDRQEKFARLLPRLLDYVNAQGYGVRLGETWRSDATAHLDQLAGKGIDHSLHRLRLAVDFMLAKDGQLLTDSKDYAFAGAYWKALDTDCCWGGDFKDAKGDPKPDGDHFSITYQGVK